LPAVLKTAAAPFALAVVAAVLCYVAAGMSLGFYLGPIALASLILPPLIAGERDRICALILAAAVIDGIGVVWFVAALGARTTLLQWLACYIVLAAYAWALCGLTRILRSAPIVTVLALAWLTWPVWLGPHVSAAAVAWLAPAHPLLAINHVLLDLGVWTQQRLMYRLTTLGQDVPYTLPRSIWPCVALHALIGLTALWPARAGRAKEPSAVAAVAAGT
jgi:hypothetical protein